MKTIRKLNAPTPGLAEYLNAVGDNANWENFRSHNAGAAYRELRDALIQNQHGLCAYCEIELIELDYQIEHVIPQSDPQYGASGEVDITNLIACCKGGTSSVFAPSQKSNDEGRYLEPIKYNMSCGQAKGNHSDADFLDPRKLPALPSLTKVLRDGRIEADEEACRLEGMSPIRVTRTIEILNLNAERLRLAREKWWNDLVDRSGQIDDSDMMSDWIRAVLIPDENDQLDPFFTTSRCYFGPLGERVLARQPQPWI